MQQIASQPHLDFTSYITERAQLFTGRQWVFAALDRWMSDATGPRYFLITGAPGVGKSAFAARLTQCRPLAAAHFCIAHRSETLDPLSFVHALAQQLTQIEGFSEGIQGSTQGPKVSGQVRVEGANYGQVIGVQIKTLLIQAPSAAIAFTRIITEPLQRLYAAGFTHPLMILVDALDEAVQYSGGETIASLLANTQGLPGPVRFVLTSRPDNTALRQFEQVPALLLDVGRAENQQDIRSYAQARLAASVLLQQRLGMERIEQANFIEQVATASEGNFLYLAWLFRTLEAHTQSAPSLHTFPQGLDGIYRDFLRTRSIGQDLSVWRTIYRPVLGILAAAKAPLSAQQLAWISDLPMQMVADVVRDMGQFLDPVKASQGRFQVYHQSIAEFLGSEEQAQEFWIDPSSVHQVIVRRYQKQASSWEAVEWQNVDDYGLHYLSTHLYALRAWSDYRQSLYDLICQPLMQEKERRFIAQRSFAGDVALALKVAEEEVPLNVLQLVRTSLLSTTLHMQAQDIPPAVLRALVKAGLAEQALEMAALMQSTERLRAFLCIGDALVSQKEEGTASGVFLQAFQEALQEERKPVLLHEIALGLYQTGQPQQAVQALRKLAQSTDTFEDLHLIASTLVQQGNSSEATRVIQQAVRVVKKIDFPEREIYALGQAVDLFVQMGNAPQALNVIQHAIEIAQGFSSDHQAESFGKIAALLVQIGHTPQVLDLARHLLWLTQQLPEADQTSFLRGRAGALCQIASTFAQLGHVEQVLPLTWQAFQAIQAHGFEEDLRGDILRQMPEALAYVGTNQQSMDMVQSILWVAQQLPVRLEFEKSSSLDAIARAMMQWGQDQQALQVAWHISDNEKKAETFCRLATILVRRGDHQRANDVLQHSLQVSQLIASTEPKIGALHSIATLLIELGDFSQATAVALQPLQVARQVEDNWWRSQALLQISRNISSLRRLPQVSTLAQQVLEMIRPLTDIEQKAEILEILIRYLVQPDQKQQALSAAQFCVQEASQIADPGRRTTVLCRIVDIMLELGQIQQAVSIARQVLLKARRLKPEDAKDQMLHHLARTLIQRQQGEHALQVVQQIEEKHERAEALSQCASILASLDDRSQATNLLQQILQIAGQIGAARPQVQSARSLAHLGQQEQARQIVQQVKSQNQEVEVLGQLASALVELGEQVEATRLAQQILQRVKQVDNEWLKANGLCSVVGVLVQVGQVQQALQEAQQVKDGWGKAIILSQIALALEQSGDHSQAPSLAQQALQEVETVSFPGIINQIARSLAQPDNQLQAVNVSQQVMQAVVPTRQDDNETYLVPNLRKHSARARGQLAVILAQVNRGDQALQIVGQITYEDIKASALAQIALAFAQTGNQSQAATVTQQALYITRSILDDRTRASILSQISAALARAQQRTQALKIWQLALTTARMVDRSCVFTVLMNSMHLFAEFGQEDIFWKVYQAVREVDSWWSVNSFRNTQ